MNPKGLRILRRKSYIGRNCTHFISRQVELIMAAVERIPDPRRRHNKPLLKKIRDGSLGSGVEAWYGV